MTDRHTAGEPANKMTQADPGWARRTTVKENRHQQTPSDTTAQATAGTPNKNVTDAPPNTAPGRRRRQRQIDRTKEDFLHALDRLLLAKRLSAITVSALCDEAHYARRTFYRHFTSVRDVLTSRIDAETARLYADLGRSHGFAETVGRFFGFWQRRTQLLRILDDNDCLHLLLKSWTDDLDRSALARIDTDGTRYGPYFGLGGMYQMLVLWCARDFRDTPQELELAASRIVRHLEETAPTSTATNPAYRPHMPAVTTDSHRP